MKIASQIVTHNDGLYSPCKCLSVAATLSHENARREHSVAVVASTEIHVVRSDKSNVTNQLLLLATVAIKKQRLSAANNRFAYKSWSSKQIHISIMYSLFYSYSNLYYYCYQYN